MTLNTTPRGLLLAAALTLTLSTPAAHAQSFGGGTPGDEPSATAADEAGSPQELVEPALVLTGPPSGQLRTVVGLLDARNGRGATTLRALERLLIEQPQVTSEIPGMLLAGDIGDGAAAVVALALENTGTPQAQRALGAIARDPRQRHMDRLRAVMASAGLDEPRDESIADLWALASTRVDERSTDVSNTAHLALGALASTLRTSAGGKPGRYEGLRGALTTTLATTGDPHERSIVLLALGNAHDPRSSVDILPHLEDELAPVRASAARALGMVHDPSVAEPLALYLEREPRGAVRSALVRSMTRLPASDGTVRAVRTGLEQETHPVARADMVSFLVENADRVPDLDALLRHLRATDPSGAVREAALQGLADR